MQLAGEFLRADGAKLPNNVSRFGFQTILRAAWLDANFQIFAGLCQGIPNLTGELNLLAEPTIGVGGYQRIAIERSLIGWPNEGIAEGNKVWLETKELLFATTGPYDKEVSRIFLTSGNTGLETHYYCLSASFEPIMIEPRTDENRRKFKYKFFGY